jgi:Leucine-rich repeat (LRR) protein
MRFYDLKSALLRPDEVTELFLNGNEWTEIPVAIWEFTTLQVLDLSNNRIVELSENIGRLSQLRTLNLSQNQLQTLPQSLTALGELQKLNLTNNRLAKFPKVLAQLNGLKELFLAKNQLKSLDFSGTYPQLQVLNAAENKIQALNWGKCSFPKLEKLELAKNKLKEVVLGEPLPSLRYLNLAHNKLEQLPQMLTDSAYLQNLLAAKNKLANLPEQIGNWGWLKQLDLAVNQLVQLPERISQCSRLEQLDVSKNKLTVLPSLPQSIRVLQLSCNELAYLPESFSSLNHLMELNLSNNPLVEPPRGLSQLPKFKSLSIDGETSAEWLLSLNRLNKLQGWRDAAARQNLLQVLKLAAKCALNSSTRVAFFKLLQTADLQAIHQVPLRDLLLGIGNGPLSLKTLLIQELKQRGKQFTDLVPSRDLVAIVGKTKLARNNWKTRLAAQNIKVTFELTAAATHVVLGNGEYLQHEINSIQVEKIVWLEEQQLLQWLEQAEGLHLVLPDKEQELQALKRLLLHRDPVNTAIAAQTLWYGGVPQAILPYVLIAYKWLPPSAKVRKTLHHLLETHWPIPFAVVSRKKIQLNRNQEVAVFQQNMEKLLAGTKLVVPDLAAEGLI